MTKGLYKCDDPRCPGHSAFTQTCSTMVVQVDDYAGLKPFQDALFLDEPETEQPTEPSAPITDDMNKSGGRATQEMRAYNNKAWFTPKPRTEQKIR